MTRCVDSKNLKELIMTAAAMPTTTPAAPHHKKKHALSSILAPISHGLFLYHLLRMKTSMSFIHDDPICEVVGLSLMSLCFFISDNRRLFFDVVKYALARPQGVLICLKSRQHHGLKMHGKKKE